MLPEIFPLLGDELRNWLRTAGQGIFSLFETGAEALDFARSQGMSIRTADFYEIRREVLSLNLYQENISNYSDDGLVPAAWHIDDHGLNLNSSFLYRVRVDGLDPETGESVQKFFAVASDRQLTPGEVKDRLSSMIVGEEEFYEVIAENMTLTSALAMPGSFGM